MGKNRAGRGTGCFFMSAEGEGIREVHCREGPLYRPVKNVVGKQD